MVVKICICRVICLWANADIGVRNSGEPITMPCVKRDVEPLICYSASCIHPTDSVPNPHRRDIERNVLRLLWRISRIVLILCVVSKLKQGSIVSMKLAGLCVADIKHKKGGGRSLPQSNGNCLSLGNQCVDQSFWLGHFVAVDIQTTNDVTECGLSADGLDVGHL